MYCRNCGKELPEDAKFCPWCGTKVMAPGEVTAPEPQDEVGSYEGNTKGNWRKWILPTCIAFAVVFTASFFLTGHIRQQRAEARCVQTTAASQPSFEIGDELLDWVNSNQSEVREVMDTTRFANDVEELAKMMEDSFSGSASVSWLVNGMKFSATIRMKTISSDDLSAAYASDPAAQVGIDKIAASQKEANQAVCDKLKSNGHSGFTVVFSMITSDNVEICTVENGEITYCISADNFRLG